MFYPTQKSKKIYFYIHTSESATSSALLLHKQSSSLQLVKSVRMAFSCFFFLIFHFAYSVQPVLIYVGHTAKQTWAWPVCVWRAAAVAVYVSMWLCVCASRTHRVNDSLPYGPPAVVSHSKSTWSLYKSVPSRLVQLARWDSSLSSWLAGPHCIKSLALSIRLINLNTCLCSDYSALAVSCIQSEPLDCVNKSETENSILCTGLCLLVNGAHWDIKWTQYHLSIYCLYSAVCLD